MMKARLRRDLVGDGYVPFLISINTIPLGLYLRWDWEGMEFECEQPDILDDEEFNLILKPRALDRIFLAQSGFFEFSNDEGIFEEEENAT